MVQDIDFTKLEVVKRYVIYSDFFIVKEKIWIKGHHNFAGALWIKGLTGPETEFTYTTTNRRYHEAPKATHL